MLRNRLLILPLLAATFAVAACGNDKNDEAAATPAATETATDAPAETPTPAASEAKKPVVKVPKGPPPKKLVIKDLKKGTGAEATDGSTVSVQYVGVLYDGGKQFDASWDRGQPFSFPLGAGQVIPGWDQGVKGMKVGGRRELIIPPDLGYGAQGAGADIPPNAALIFVVDLLDVQQ
nr:FKBP-type peptidyl-prolyl cis-trans isomerase [Candidatus Solirubrobacter pratensis]